MIHAILYMPIVDNDNNITNGLPLLKSLTASPSQDPREQ